MQTNLFDETMKETTATTQNHKLYFSDEDSLQNTPPLSHQVRPKFFIEFEGINDLKGNYPFLDAKILPSFIVWGPPGVGKTTLALVFANEKQASFFSFSAVMGNLSELRKVMDNAHYFTKQTGIRSIIFIDELHRFNKSQQDALLPRVEMGHFTLIGATTENPKFVLNNALLSRLHIVFIDKINVDSGINILGNSLKRLGKDHLYAEACLKLISENTDGDIRKALNILELLLEFFPKGIAEDQMDDPKFFESLKTRIIKSHRLYDRKSNRHYDVISAFIKSMRGNDPDSALLWLAVMLEGGEDPLFIARRLVIFASEDVGNADPWALTLATSALTVVSQIGMPESRISLAQATTYLASTIKSNAAYKGINQALEYVKNNKTIEVPNHLKSNGLGYKYPHDFGGHVFQEYSPHKIPTFYRPKNIGRESMLKERLLKVWNKERNND